MLIIGQMVARFNPCAKETYLSRLFARIGWPQSFIPNRFYRAINLRHRCHVIIRMRNGVRA